ncbi:unnamed protein product [Mycena citricolor]|uniref:ABC transporter domain-containing protein n=1 Tax=Mycena citricolor TaxID=2018698 RepID=A0AAD2HMC9_9AGAR|nr:unnamed protein product [Mycena citricolor]
MVKPSAGKSTSLSVIGGLTGRTSGQVVFEGGLDRPPRGRLSIVPQKNVLISELTCLQTLRVLRAVKWSNAASADEDLEQLLRDCDLEHKIHAQARTLSGGQKRKLQLAIGLVAGSEVRQERTIVFTTHFLDEADLLADNIAILAAPGKLVAAGSPVALKGDLGQGYSVQVSLAADSDAAAELLHRIQTVAPQAHMSVASIRQSLYHLRAKDSQVVDRVLQLVDS